MKGQILGTYGLICLSVIVGVAGQTVIKLGVEDSISTEGVSNLTLSVLAQLIRSPLVLFGLFLYGIGAGAWILVLSRVDLSFAYPFLALNFVLITIASKFVLSESISPHRWLGILVICAGIIIVAVTGQ